MSEWILASIALLAILAPVVIPMWAYAIYYPVLAIVSGLIGARLVVDAFHQMMSDTHRASEPGTLPVSLDRWAPLVGREVLWYEEDEPVEAEDRGEIENLSEYFPRVEHVPLR